jgi:hypothetical protein
VNEEISAVVGKIPNIESAPLALNALVVKHAFSTTRELLRILKRHYKHQALRNIYRIIGSFDFLGNPISLVAGLGQGVYDFFYEPIKGIVAGPEGFSRGLKQVSMENFRYFFSFSLTLQRELYRWQRNQSERRLNLLRKSRKASQNVRKFCCCLKKFLTDFVCQRLQHCPWTRNSKRNEWEQFRNGPATLEEVWKKE